MVESDETIKESDNRIKYINYLKDNIKELENVLDEIHKSHDLKIKKKRENALKSIENILHAYEVGKIEILYVDDTEKDTVHYLVASTISKYLE